MADETKRYLDYDGLAYLVKKLTNKIEAAGGGSGSGTSGHTGACDGVYVAYVDYDGVRRICSASEWSDSLGAAQGVMVGDGTHEVLVAPSHSASIHWSAANELVGGIITTASSSDAQKDFNGRLNTEGIAAMGGDYLSEGYAPGFCRSYAYGAVPAGEWWLPSAGELWLMMRHTEDIGAAMSAIGADAPDFGFSIWTSTQVSDLCAWFSLEDELYAGSGTLTKSTPYIPALPVSSWDWVE